MIDPFTAFAVAQSAVAGIKKAVALGKDIHGLAGEFSKFFDAKDTVVTASAKTGNKQSATGEALQIVMQAKALHDAETELKQLLIYSGNAQLWDQMLMERNRINRDRAKAERDATTLREKAAKRMREIVGALALTAAIVCFLIGVALATLEITKG